MSSISIRRPEFRLYLSYPDIILTSGTRTLGRVATSAAALRSELDRLLEPVRRARGRLVAVLPESEVWRGYLDLAGDSRAARRAGARSAVAERIAAAPDDVAVVLGPRDADGFFPVAGVRRSSLVETRTLLAAFGLRPAAIVGAGLFPGFSAAPRLAGWSLALPRPTLALPPLTLPRLTLPDLRLPTLSLPTPSLPTLSLPALSLPALSIPALPALASLPLPRHRLGAIAGAGAVVSLAVAVLGLPNPDTPRSAATPEAATLAESALPPIELPPMAEIVLPAPPLALAYAAPPKPRPAEARAEPLVTVAARNMPKDLPVVVAPPRPTRTERLAELTGDLAAAPARALDSITAPLRRPAAAAKPEPKVEEIARTAMPALPAPATTTNLRPLPRPSVAAARPAPAAAPAAAALAPRPRATAGSAEPAMLVASLDPAPLVQERLAAATAAAALAAPPPAPPPARPAAVAARPAPAPAKIVAPAPAKVAARPAPVVVRPQPVPVKQPAPQRLVAAAPAAKVVAPPAPVRQKVVAKPAPVRQAVPVKKVPVRQAATQVRQAPQPVAAVAPVLAAKPAKQKPAAERVGLSRRDISLVGVFGGADGRHALVRLPNGNIEKVKAGDRVHGVQVAAISADSVRLTGRGRDTVLRLPD